MSEAKQRPDRSKNVRVPLSQRNVLTFRDLDPDFEHRIISDKDDRIQRALEGGYEFVESKEKLGDVKVAQGTVPGAKVATPVGGGVTGYLMRIPKAWYKEDQLAKEQAIQKTEEAMKPIKAEGQYGEGLKTE